MSGLERTDERARLLSSQGSAGGIDSVSEPGDDLEILSAQIERIDALFRANEITPEEAIRLKDEFIKKMTATLDRGEKIERIVAQTEDLQFKPAKFQSRAKDLPKRKLRICWPCCCFPY